jgi:hypothetical protein
MKEKAVAEYLNKDDAKAVAVLATATVRMLGREAPVVVSLQRLLRERSTPAWDDACTRFNSLDPGVRARIGATAPAVARRRVKMGKRPPTLPGLLGAINRR